MGSYYLLVLLIVGRIKWAKVCKALTRAWHKGSTASISSHRCHIEEKKVAYFWQTPFMFEKCRDHFNIRNSLNEYYVPLKNHLAPWSTLNVSATGCVATGYANLFSWTSLANDYILCICTISCRTSTAHGESWLGLGGYCPSVWFCSSQWLEVANGVYSVRVKDAKYPAPGRSAWYYQEPSHLKWL